ncbi:hypothetical protein AcV5_007960 [Taiwanofungus camphoratus]|nr:hypothetical protein AcV5_007960 [Antrodia cinnamomea]
MHCPALLFIFAGCIYVASSVYALPFSSQTSLGLKAVQQAFYDANIPADANITFDPSILLDVIFPQNASSPGVALAAPNTTLSVAEVARVPYFVVSGPHVHAHDRLVVIAIDLDAPSPHSPSASPVRHFLGGAFEPVILPIPGAALLVNSTPAVSDWLSPAPASVDPHRYVFLVFAQPPGFGNQTLVNASTDRLNWDMSAFVQQVALGSPLGGNFMLVGADS